MGLSKMFTPKTVEELEAKIAETKQNGETWDCDLSDLNVAEIKYAFSGCTGLTSVVIPEGVTEIGENAFRGCENLKEVTLPVGVKKIDESAFNECKALETIYVPAKKADYYEKRLPEELHDKIKELEPVKKAKKK